MKEQVSPQFLDRRSYRRKRLIDAARLLPLFGAALIFRPIPLLFIPSEGGAVVLAVYLFVLWMTLIVSAFLLARRLGRDAAAD